MDLFQWNFPQKSLKEEQRTLCKADPMPGACTVPQGLCGVGCAILPCMVTRGGTGWHGVAVGPHGPWGTTGTCGKGACQEQGQTKNWRQLFNISKPMVFFKK